MIKPKETKKALTFMDDRGWLYQVRKLLGGDMYRVFCRKPRKNMNPDIGWKSRPRSRIHFNREDAEDTLRALAKRKGWTKIAAAEIKEARLRSVLASKDRRKYWLNMPIR